jgi:hypothetical protein
MSASKHMLPPPPDVRFDTSDAAKPAPAAPATLTTALITDRSARMVVRIPPKEPPGEADASLASGSVVSGVITEDAEAIHINERRDTIESPPTPRPIVDEPTVPTVAPTHVGDVPPEPATPRASGDAVAAQRGIPRIRLPRLSRRYDALAEERAASPSLASSSSRRLVIASLALAGTCLAVTGAAIAWGRASRSQPTRAATSTPVAVPVIVTVAATAPVPVGQVSAPEQAPAAAPHPCRLDVRATVDGAVVWIDGVRIGDAPVVAPVTCNTVANVELRHPRYATFQQAVTVDAAAPEGTSRLDARLERENTTLTLWSEPAGAQVTYNGSVVGITPVTVKVPRYEQGTVWFRAPNHEPDWRRIVPTEATKTLSITLKGMILPPPS